MKTRKLSHVIPSVATSDGAGVKLRRSLGAAPGLRLDPFLMLDEFGTENPDDYIAGFPPHPHRGFETVTYMLDGHMRHEDHMGNVGELTEGGVQWMTAGRGVIHSEMPQQNEGRMRGFQLWLNLPANEKMKPASYVDLPRERIPVGEFAGGTVRVIAGSLELDDQTLEGPISGLTTEPIFYDVTLEPGAVFEAAVPPGHNSLVYAYEGELSVGPATDFDRLRTQAAGLLGPGESIRLFADGDEPARFILLAGKPIGEPIVQRGPFVMNTREEIEQAVRDYTEGTLVA